MNKENVILIDFDAPKDWEFHKAIEQTTKDKWIIYKVVSNKNHRGVFQNLIRYIKYFYVPMKIAKKRNGYCKILAWQQFYGLILAFYFRIMHIKKAPEIVVMTFIYKPKKFFIGKIYDRFIRYIVTSNYIKYFIVFSENEKKLYADYFGIPESNFVFVTLGYPDRTKNIPVHESNNYYFAGGRSNRDYNFLIDAWKGKAEQLEIICDTLSVKNAANNIKIYNKCYNNDYFYKLARCKAVIVPLNDTHISSGQLLIIQAMMYGKPVIVTENDSVMDYVDTGRTGFIIKKTEQDLFEVITALEDEKYYEKISINAREQFERTFSIYAMGITIGKILFEEK